MSKKKPEKKTTAPKKIVKKVTPVGSKTLPIKEKAAVKEPVKTDNNNNKLLWWGLSLLAIIVLTSFAYYTALDNEFVDWDDTTYVINNDLVRQQTKPTTVSDVFSTPVSLNYHPLTILTMRWNNNVCANCKEKISAKPFITWNLILHIVNACLVFFLTFFLSKQNWFVGLFSAAVFALHPMHVESVAWVSERKDVLYVLFYLLGLLTYNRYLDSIFLKEKPDIKWLLAAFGCFVLACLSKAMAVVFPLTLILVHYWRYPTEKPLEAFEKSFSPKRLLELLPFFALALFFGMMALSVQSGGDFNGLLHISDKSVAVNKFDTFSVLQRLQFAGYGFCTYLYKFFVPTEMCTLHPYPTQAFYDSTPLFNLVLIGFLVILGGTAFSMIKTKIFAFGIGFYFVTVAFVLQFISVGTALMADRYTYLPYLGVTFILGTLVEMLPRQGRYICYGLAVVASVFWIVQTRAQVETWQDSVSLWTKVIEVHSQSEQAYSVRGNYYGKLAGVEKDAAIRKGYMEKAEADFRNAIKYESTRADVFEGLGNIESMNGKTEDALMNYNRAIELNPGKATVYINRGITHSMRNDLKASLKDMEMAVQLDPQPTHILYRGIARESLGDKEGAKVDYKEVLKLTPKNEEAAKRLQALGG